MSLASMVSLERTRSRPGPREIAVGAIAAMMIAFAIAPVAHAVRATPNKDYDLWWQVGRDYAAGADVYPTSRALFPFMYPPSCAVLLTVPAVLPRALFVLALVLLNSASWAFCIAASLRMATGKVRGTPGWLLLGPSLAVIPFVSDTYLLGQPALLLLALVLGAFVLLQRRPEIAGALIAVAAAIKAYPVLVVGYFVYRGHFRAAAATVLVLAALLFVAPMAFRTPGQAVDDFRRWTSGMVLKYDETTIGQRPDRAYSFKNQSIQATVHRLSRPVLADGEADRTWRVNLLDLDFRSSTHLMLATIAGLGLATLASWPRRRERTARTDAVEQAMVCILVLMLAPLSFNYSYVWLIFPFTILAGLARGEPAGSFVRRVTVASLAVAVVLLALAIPAPRVVQAYGNVFFAGLVAWLGLALVGRRLAPASEGEGDPALTG